MNTRSLELKLRNAMEAAIENGWAPRPVFEVSILGTCCAIGALSTQVVAFDDGISMITGIKTGKEIARELGVSERIICAVWRGFDGRTDWNRRPNVTEKQAWDIGARLRRDYYETTDDVVEQ